MNVRKHPPERRRRGVILAAHGCCCCCCCCLHSLGGLIGSAVSGVKAPPTPEARRTVKVYWLILLALTALTVASLTHENRGNLTVGLVLTAMILPGVQLMTSFFTFCASMFMALDKPTLGRITWKGFLWGVVGFLIMAVPLMLMSYA